MSNSYESKDDSLVVSNHIVSLHIAQPIAPPEIFTEIIDQLAALLSERSPSQLKENMRNVALVCKSFLPIARVHLFHDIDISGEHDKTGNRRTSLANLLQNDRCLARHVNHVKYSFKSGTEHTMTAPLSGPLSIFVNLPRVNAFSVTGGKNPRYYPWNDITNTGANIPPFGWRALLQGFIENGALTTIDISDVALVPIVGTFSIPTLVSLTIRNCFTAYSEESTIHRDGMTDCLSTLDQQFNLKVLRVYNTDRSFTKHMPFTLIARCTQLQHLILDSQLSYPRYRANELSSNLGLPALQLLFSRLESLKVAEGEELEWMFFYSVAQKQGVSAFPALKNLSIGLAAERHRAQRIPPSLYDIFNHTPVLERLEIFGKFQCFIFIDVPY